MFRTNPKKAVLLVSIFCIFYYQNVFSETGDLSDHPISVVLVCEPSARADKPRYYKSTSLFFKRLKNKRLQENGTAFFVGYGAFASESPTEQLNLAGQNGYDLYLFPQTAPENLPTSAPAANAVPWISFVVEKKETVKLPPKKKSKSAKSKNKKPIQPNASKTKSGKKTRSGTKKKIPDSKQTTLAETPPTKTIVTQIGNASFELSFDVLKFWFSTTTNPTELSWTPERILFLAGDKTADEWNRILSEKPEDTTAIRLLYSAQDLRFNEGIYYTGCASPKIPNGISVLNFFFRGNRLIRLKQESFSLNSDGSGKSWELE
ncbi:hypothetical protein CH379_015505 [Leptospira ellisii]|uniref:Uncharacterized protein n=1 Tax=Leptospira ellisii TaxID=2023197 RepID=A0A2N0B7L5_9LEPT|nr:hypothetical protein [Leptospira ellisii]MDV6237036.1 hypothetical protein [Leptospira ellisii]PJZ92545.1 hypothetical protein CH379_12550 [Leptospira ellisii]PKA04959.1 hypothetical protein CH375_07930 [Leptospira ellisii]